MINGPLELEIIDSLRACEGVRGDWNRLVRDDVDPVQGHDGTATFEWLETVGDTLLEASEIRILVLREHERVVALFPVVLGQRVGMGRRLYMPTMLYGGRSGVLADRVSAGHLHALSKG